ncbi:hypothetical protein GCM10025771_09170 [Niveibacterium umoris]|uniref:General secretion pathway protein G n=1 Tax=Niveibacterium umoris TaxID=1193620 RepID=A0A840BM26_9RHOO|nr:prepilin-type N-terminal cleavage/methylation domain-containing protein [Niveibacterium umoris]MBB4013534.1 general secretion pathway protein G [Niveibacterium umoris]
MARTRGFTLIELLVVLAIVALLLTLALPRYLGSAELAKERVLVENLRTTRDAIDKHFADRGRYPESLEVLVDRRYLRELPLDPVADSRTAWRIEPPPNGRMGGVYDLHSSASGSSRDGRPFSEL